MGHAEMSTYSAAEADPPALAVMDAAATRHEARVYGDAPFWDRVSSLTSGWRDFTGPEQRIAHNCYSQCMRMSADNRAQEWMRLVLQCREYPEFCK